MSATASRITGVSIVCSTFCSGADHRRHQSSVCLDFVNGIHRWPVDSPRIGQVTPKMFPIWWTNRGTRSSANTGRALLYIRRSSHDCYDVSTPWYLECLSVQANNRKHRSSALLVLVTEGFPSQRVHNSEMISFSWCHHVIFVLWHQLV